MRYPTRHQFVCLALFILAPFRAAQAADAIPDFGYIADGWVNPPLTFVMSDIWHAFGYPESGTNYYTLDGPRNPSTPYWERFNPLSPTYESVVGVYIIRDFSFAAEWQKTDLHPSDIAQSVQRILDLAVVDYYAWNTAYGAPTQTSVVPGAVAVIKASDGWFHVLTLVKTYSDFGSATSLFPWLPAYSTYSALVDPYQQIYLEVDLMLKYDPDHQNMLVIYGNGTHYRLKSGQPMNTPIWALFDMRAMMASMRFH